MFKLSRYSLNDLFIKFWLGGSAILIVAGIILFYAVIVPLVQRDIITLHGAIYYVGIAGALKIILSGMVTARLFTILKTTAEPASLVMFAIVLGEFLFFCWLEYAYISGLADGHFFP